MIKIECISWIMYMRGNSSGVMEREGGGDGRHCIDKTRDIGHGSGSGAWNSEDRVGDSRDDASGERAWDSDGRTDAGRGAGISTKLPVVLAVTGRRRPADAARDADVAVAGGLPLAPHSTGSCTDGLGCSGHLR